MAWELEQQQSQNAAVSRQSKGKGEILVGLPYKENFSAKFVAGIMNVKFPAYFAHSFYFETGQPLDIARNVVISNGLQRNVSHVFFLDQDIILKNDTILALHETYMPIVGAVYFGRNPPYNVVANISGNPLTRETVIEKINSTPNGKALMEVHEVGMGATLIDTRVFDRIATVHKLPFFCMIRHPNELAEIEKDDTGIYYDYNEAKELNYRCKYCGNTLIAPFFDYRIGKYSENSLSEDYYFCKLAREAGFSIYLSLATDVEHENKMFTIGMQGLTNSTISAGVAT